MTVLELDGKRYRLVDDVQTSSTDQVRARALGALTVSAVLSVSAFGITALEDTLSSAADIGARVLFVTSPLFVIGALVVSPLAEMWSQRERPAETKPIELPRPKPGRGPGVQMEGLSVKLERARARAKRARQMQHSVQPVQASRVEDWVPGFYRVTSRMYHEPLTRARFDALWEGGQALYYRYVKPRGVPVPDWDHGRWLYLGMIRPSQDGRGTMEFCMPLDQIFHHTPRLWRYALRQGHSPTGAGAA